MHPGRGGLAGDDHPQPGKDASGRDNLPRAVFTEQLRAQDGGEGQDDAGGGEGQRFLVIRPAPFRRDIGFDHAPGVEDAHGEQGDGTRGGDDRSAVAAARFFC